MGKGEKVAYHTHTLTHTHTHLVYYSQTVDSHRLQTEGSLPQPPDMPCPGGRAYAEDVSSVSPVGSPVTEGGDRERELSIVENRGNRKRRGEERRGEKVEKIGRRE